VLVSLDMCIVVVYITNRIVANNNVAKIPGGKNAKKTKTGSW
jgi:hypothetical protein